LRLEQKSFATESRYKTWYNPYLPFYYKAHQIGGPYVEYELDVDSEPWPRKSLVAHTTCLTSLEDDDEIRRTLLRSANLPLIFKIMQFDGDIATDGAVTDDVPIYPAVSEGCDTIIVIYLNNNAQPTSDEMRRRIANQYFRREILEGMSPTEARALYKEFCDNDLSKRTRPIFRTTTSLDLRFI